MLLALAFLLGVRASVGQDTGTQRELLQSNVIVNQNTAYDSPSKCNSYCSQAHAIWQLDPTDAMCQQIPPSSHSRFSITVSDDS